MRPCHVEMLETRRLLVGDVSAVVDSSGNLFIDGDNAANSIVIQGLASDRRTLVVSPGDITQTINGSDAAVTFSNVTRNVFIRLNGGNDSLSIHDAEILKALRIDLGNGSDTLQAQRVIVHRDLAIHGGFQSDEVIVDACGVFTNAFISTEDDPDVIVLTASSFRGSVQLFGGNDDDVISANFQNRFAVRPVLDGGTGTNRIDEAGLSFHYDFNTGRHGWSAGFSDWVVDQNYAFQSGLRALPGSVAPGHQGFLLSADNRADNLFMYLTKTLTGAQGLNPGQRLLITFAIEFASNVPNSSDASSQADSVFLKAGASGLAPANTLFVPGVNRLNLHHGQGAAGGSDISLVGSIANGTAESNLPDPQNPPYRAVRRVYVHPNVITVNSLAQLHLIVGTDSGFEGTTSLYYQRITVHLTEV